MQLATIDRGARKYGLHYTDTEKEKTLFVQVPDISAGNQQNIYLPYDNDLKNAIITGMRISNGGNSAPLNVLPNNLNGIAIANSVQLASFCLTIVNRFGVRIHDRLPAYFLLQTSTINQDTWFNCMFTFEPGMSYFSYFDTSSSYGKTYIAISFRYKSLIVLGK